MVGTEPSSNPPTCLSVSSMFSLDKDPPEVYWEPTILAFGKRSCQLNDMIPRHLSSREETANSAMVRVVSAFIADFRFDGFEIANQQISPIDLDQPLCLKAAQVTRD